LRNFRARPLIPPVLLAAALLLLPGPAVPGPLSRPNPHDHFRQPAQCPKCHLPAESKPGPRVFAASSVGFCLECHLPEERGRSHPVLVHAERQGSKVKVPPEFPLGEGDRVICLSCHTAHGPYESGVRAFAGQEPAGDGGAEGTPSFKTYFLRRSDPAGKRSEAICNACHKAP
jgi:predicted CXXCH cytochrome family protein